MAERRMFAKTIIDSDAFLDMPLSTQALYFHLSMRADDDGFINNPKKVQRMIGGSDDDLKLLVLKRFVIPFESGVCVIKHWRIHNYIQKDRYKPTIYHEEKARLVLKKNNAYTQCIQDVSSLETQVRLGKDRLGEVREEEETAGDPPPPPPPDPDPDPPKPVAHVRSQYGWVKLTDEQYDRLIQEYGLQKARAAIDYVDESAQTTGNKNKWKDWNLVVRKCIREGWGQNRQNSGSPPPPKPRRDTGFQSGNPFLEMLEEERGRG